MFKSLRLQFDLTQQDVADATHRSPNYILKAEDLTFPAPPPALLQFYTEMDSALDKELLTSWYYEAQKTRRELWLDEYIPSPVSMFTFRASWLEAQSYREQEWVTPTQYRLSKGLCIPASVVYNMDRYPLKAMPAAVEVVMKQLIAYTQSGRFSLSENYSFDTLESLERIKKEFSK